MHLFWLFSVITKQNTDLCEKI